MLHAIKRRAYFFVAYYFRLWAAIKLHRWRPYVIVVTGSAGKTTLLHLLEAQLGAEAHYSHHANGAVGIPFDILGLTQVSRSRLDWLGLFIMAPIKAFTRPHPEHYYVAEVDADRPHEARFLANFLRPRVSLWVSTLHTHTDRFDTVVNSGAFTSPESAIAYEYGNLLARTSELTIINGDSPLMLAQIKRTTATVEKVLLSDLKSYTLADGETSFSFADKTYHLPALVPQATYYQVAMADKLLAFLKKTPDERYSRFVMPPGRSTVFQGIKHTTLIDSTYNNSNIDSMATVIDMFEQYSAKEKWLVLGDLLEQGKDELREHQKIAQLLDLTHFDRLLLVGKRIKTGTYPALDPLLSKRTIVQVFTHPVELRSYLQQELKGGETVLFKGAGFLEGVIEILLLHKEDSLKLVRREPIQERRRKEFGL